MGWICVPIILMVGWYSYRGWEALMAERVPQVRETPVTTIGSPPPQR